MVRQTGATITVAARPRQTTLVTAGYIPVSLDFRRNRRRFSRSLGLMEWTDQAIMLGARRQGEGSLILSLLTRLHGRHKGLVRGGAKSRQRGLYEPGNLVIATWHARLAEHLGLLQIEPGQFFAAPLLDDPLRLACLEAAVALAEVGLPERSPYPGIFDGLETLLQRLAADEGYAAEHLHWELGVLADLGYGLDLSSCAVTGVTKEPGLGLAAYRPRRVGRSGCPLS